MTLIWAALGLGAVYALVAIGYNIVYVSSGHFNFAQAQLMMIGTFIAYSGLGSWNLPWLAVLVVAMVIAGAVAGVEERIAIRPVRESQNILITTIGAAIVMDWAVQDIWGPNPLTVPFPLGDQALTLLGGRVYPVELTLIGFVVLLVVGFHFYGQHSKIGLAMSAIAEDSEAAQLRGINVRAVGFGAFVAAGALGGAAGLFVGPLTYAFTGLGASLALKGFVVLAIGGFGSMPGALAGAMLVGIVEAYIGRYAGSQYATLGVFALLLTVLLVRPSGLFGRMNERAV